MLQWHAANAKDNPKIIRATERCAAGIIQAIGHFNLGPSISPRDVSDFHDCHMEKFVPAFEVVKFNLFVEKWRWAEVEKSELYLENMKSVCVSFKTFLAFMVYHNDSASMHMHAYFFFEKNNFC